MPKQPLMNRLAPEDFVILPWGWTAGEADVLAEIYRCGFNLAGFVQPGDLDVVAQTGLKAIVSDERIHVTDAAANLDEEEIAQRVSSMTSQVKNHPALFGYYLRDEPGAHSYPGLARWSKALRAADPNARPYINLFPIYASAAQMEAASYGEYVDTFLKMVAPPFLSYDHYALMEDGVLRGSYFENLELIRTAALRQGIPFWNIVLSNAHFTYAEPSPAGLRFQVYTSLAYGARGISFFTYFTPDTGNYRLAPINPFGEKTPTWAMLREVLLQVHALGPIYLQLNSLNVFHSPEALPGYPGVESSRFLEKISAGSFVIGEFQSSAGQPYVMVVNKDLHHSVNFSIQFTAPGKVLRTSPYSGAAQPVGNEDNWLAPGQGVLLSLD